LRFAGVTNTRLAGASLTLEVELVDRRNKWQDAEEKRRREAFKREIQRQFDESNPRKRADPRTTVKIVTGVALLSALLAIIPNPGPHDASGLNRTEAAYRDEMVKTGVAPNEATRMVVSMRLTPEKKRRYRYERERRQQEIEDLQTAACIKAPWLERCQ